MMKLNRMLIGLMFSTCLMAAGAALTIPKDATANTDGTYSWTDKQGKKWIYVKTPFGVSRNLEPDQARPKTARPKGIPAGAKANRDGTYSWTDKAGAKWTYVITPFGPSRTPAVAAGEAAAPQQDPNAAAVKVTDKGDTFRFERPTPFGPAVWEKKKTELTEDERRIVDLQTAEMQKANNQ